MAQLSDFRPEINLHVQSVPGVVADRIAWRAMNDFFQRTEAWQIELNSPMPYTPGETQTDPTPFLPTGVAAARVVSCRWRPDGKDILFLTRGQLDESFPGWQTEADVAPEYYTSETSGSIRLYPTSMELIPAALEMTVAATIAIGFSQFPNWVYQNYLERILPGILARLYIMPKQDWSDLKTGSAFAQGFETAIALTKSEVEAGFGRPTYSTAYGGI